MNEIEALVSIVLPTYNQAGMLKESIESCLSQSYKNIELIIVNDGSVDNTGDVVQKYLETDARVKYYKKDNGGLPRALNHGFQYAIGKYYTWTSDDNLYAENAIEVMINALEKNQEYKLVYCDYIVINESGVEIDRRNLPAPDRIFHGPTVGACFLYDAECAKEVGEYDPDWILVEDTEFFLRFASKYKLMHLNEIAPYYYRVGDHSLSMGRTIDIQLRNAELLSRYSNSPIEKLNIFSNCYYTCALWLFKKSTSRSRAAKYLMLSLLLNPFRLRSWLLVVRMLQPKWLKLMRGRL